MCYQGSESSASLPPLSLLLPVLCFSSEPSSRRPLRLASIALILAESRFSRLSCAADPLSLSLSLSLLFYFFQIHHWKLEVVALGAEGERTDALLHG